MKTSTIILAAIASALAIPPTLHAVVTAPVVITPVGVTTVANGGEAPGASADYDFFGGGAQPVEITDFTLTTPPGAQYNPASGITYSTLQPPAGGTVFTTGIGQPASGASTTPFTANLATFTLAFNPTHRLTSVSRSTSWASRAKPQRPTPVFGSNGSNTWNYLTANPTNSGSPATVNSSFPTLLDSTGASTSVGISFVGLWAGPSICRPILDVEVERTSCDRFI